jgi:hypothetical protein
MMVTGGALYSLLSRSRLVAAAVIASLAGAAAIGRLPPSTAKEVFVSVGTGEMNGVY